MYPVKKTFQKRNHCLIWGPPTVDIYYPHPKILNNLQIDGAELGNMKELRLLPLTLLKQPWKKYFKLLLHWYPVKKASQKREHWFIWGPPTVNTYFPLPRILWSFPFFCIYKFHRFLTYFFFWKSSEFKSTDYKSTWKLFLFLQARKERIIFSPKLPQEHLMFPRSPGRSCYLTGRCYITNKIKLVKANFACHGEIVLFTPYPLSNRNSL